MWPHQVFEGEQMHSLHIQHRIIHVQVLEWLGCQSSELDSQPIPGQEYPNQRRHTQSSIRLPLDLQGDAWIRPLRLHLHMWLRLFPGGLEDGLPSGQRFPQGGA